MIADSVSGLKVHELGVDEMATWDAHVRGFGNHRVVHTSAWNASLKSCGCGEPVCLLLERDGEVVASFPGLLSQVGFWKLFGSPRAGWQTVSMGPVFDPAKVTTREIFTAAISHLEKKHRVSHIELMHTQLDSDDMQDLGFRQESVPTYRAALYPNDEDATFRSLSPAARRNVRRGERLGLQVRFEDDDGFASEHFDQVREVYLRRGNEPPFGERRIRECVSHMRASGNLLSVSVLLPDSHTSIASGIFLVEGDELALWTWAHRSHYRWYRATELMTWTVMRRAIQEGCRTFEMMGRGDFKEKFGATLDITKKRWTRSSAAWLPLARSAVRSGSHVLSAVRGRVAKLSPSGRTKHPPRSMPAGSAPACVMGDIDLLRTVALAGLRPVVASTPGSPVRYSRLASQQLDWHSPRENGDQLLHDMVSWSITQPEPPVLFYDSDDTLLFISRNREKLAQHFRFLLPPAALVERLVDKLLFQGLATELGLEVPKAVTFEPAREGTERVSDVGFPAVLKPLSHSSPAWRKLAGNAKAMRLDSRQDLLDLWPQLTSAALPVVAQQLIPGDETRIESYHVYCDAKGKVVAEFTGRKIRTSPASFGDSTALEVSDAPDVITMGHDIVQRLRLVGVAKLDFKRDPAGRLFLLEVNPRFSLWHHLGAVAGLNIPALVYADLTNANRPADMRAKTGVQWCKMWSDFAVARKAGMSAQQWLAWVMSCDAKSAFSWNDPFPLVGAAISRLRPARNVEFLAATPVPDLTIASR